MLRRILRAIRQSVPGFGPSKNTAVRCSIHHRRLGLEPLEDRRLLSVGGYPDLPGLHLVDPRPDQFEGQTIYVDTDGAEGVTYKGPVVIQDIDIPAFEAPGELAGQEQEIIASVVNELEETFAGTGVTFTIDKPDPGNPYSTVFIGGGDGAFSEYGSFIGLAEEIDVGNEELTDNAFVFTESLMGNQGGGMIATTIEHEVGHLLGYEHSVLAEGNRVLSQVAAASGYIISADPDSFTAGEAKTVTVRVHNSSSAQDFKSLSPLHHLLMAVLGRSTGDSTRILSERTIVG